MKNALYARDNILIKILFYIKLLIKLIKYLTLLSDILNLTFTNWNIFCFAFTNVCLLVKIFKVFNILLSNLLFFSDWLFTANITFICSCLSIKSPRIKTWVKGDT